MRKIAEREQRENTVAGLTAQAADSVKVTEPATIPLKGSSLKLPVALLSLLFAGFTALLVGLMRAYARKGFSTANSLQQTLGMPVLGTVSRA